MKQLTFDEVEELACMMYDAAIELGKSEEEARAAAQWIWTQNPHV